MLVDIGTNTEIVVSDGQRIVAASSPAGPAFEGGLLRYGMPGADGAIEKVRIEDGGFAIEVIGDVEPQGICGSGLVDILAELRRADWMTPIGRFTDGRDEFTIVSEPRHHLLTRGCQPAGPGQGLQRRGQRILLRRLGLHPQQVDRVLLAGGFANAIDIENAIAIGFLADVRPDRVERVGNAALHGAVMLLLSRGRRARARRPRRPHRARRAGDGARLLRPLRRGLPVRAGRRGLSRGESCGRRTAAASVSVGWAALVQWPDRTPGRASQVRAAGPRRSAARRAAERGPAGVR